MTPYWLLLAFFSCGVMLSQRQPQAELQLQLQREHQQYPGWMPPVSRPGL